MKNPANRPKRRLVYLSLLAGFFVALMGYLFQSNLLVWKQTVFDTIALRSAVGTETKSVLGDTDTLEYGAKAKQNKGLVKGVATPEEQDSLVFRIKTVFKDTVSFVDALVTGSLQVDQDLDVGGSSTTAGNSTTEGDLTVGGDSTFVGDTTTQGASTVEGNSQVGGTSTVTGALTVGGAGSIAGDLTVSGEQVVTGESTLEGDVTAESDLTVEGELTAPNVVYTITAGDGIAVSGTQDVMITNDDLGSAQNIFKNFVIDGTTIAANSNTDTLTWEEGTGITLSSSGDTITVAANSSALNVSGWESGSGNVILQTSTDNVGIGTDSPGYKLHVVGTSYFSGNATFAGGTVISSGINNSSGGITNAGAITGATGFTSSGTITLSSLSTGILHSNVNGVVSSSALNLAGGGTEITGTLPVTNGGTGLTSVAAGDLLYGSGVNTLAKLGAGSDGEVLTISGGVIDWGVVPGSGDPCPTCLVTNPGSSQSITPTAVGATALVIKQASSGSVDVFRIESYDGTSTFFKVDSSGNVILGDNTTSGTFTVSPTDTDPIAIDPVAEGAGAFTGTITSSDLTAVRTWTLPDLTGVFCLSTGNCSGTSASIGGSGATNYLTKWTDTYTVTQSVLYDDGTNIGLGTTTPTSKLHVAGTLRATGNTTLNADLYVAAHATISGSLRVDQAVDFNSTFGVDGATTLGSTLDVTGLATFGGNVGIGTGSPNNKIQVVGLINFNDSSFSTALGYNASALGDYNTVVGYQAGESLDAISYDNVALGYNALTTNVQGGRFVAIGSHALELANGTEGSIAVGYRTLDSQTSGDENIAVGELALQGLTSGVGNLAFGHNVGNALDGDYNIIFGYSSGYNVSSGDYNVVLGYNGAPNLTSGSNNIVIGNNLSVPSGSGSNQLNIGNIIYGVGVDGTTSTISSGNIGIGTSAPVGRLHVTGAVVGKALALFNETGNQAILTASASGSPKFTVTNNGMVLVGTANDTLASGNDIVMANDGALRGINTFDNNAINIAGLNSSNVVEIGMSGVTTQLNGTLTSSTGVAVFSSSVRSSSAFQLADGSNSSPALHFTNDTDTGLYLLGTNSVALITGGVATNGIAINANGNVGIGTTTPTQKLHVVNSIDTHIVLQNTATDKDIGIRFTNANMSSNFWTVGIPESSTYLAFGYGSGFVAGTSERMVLNSAGNLGIGTISPNGLLNVSGAAVGKALAIFNETGNQNILVASASGTNKFTVNRDGNVGIGGVASPQYALHLASGEIHIGTNNDCNNDFCLDAGSIDTFYDYTITNHNGGDLLLMPDGNVGIGTTDAANASLDIRGNELHIYLHDTFGLGAVIRETSDNLVLQSQGGSVVSVGGATDGTSTFQFQNSSSVARFTVSDLGHVGIGVGSTAANGSTVPAINISGAKTGKALLGLNETGDQAILVASASGTNRFTILNNGNVGIGTSAPGELLTLVSATGAYGFHHTDGTVNLKSYIGTNYAKLTTTGSHGLRFGFNGTAEMLILDTTGNMGYVDTTPDSLFEISGSGTADTEMFTISSVSANDGDLLTFTRTGNLGIGSTAPIGKLNLSGAATGKALAILDETGNQNILVASASGTNVFTLQRDGNVGINTSAPIHALEVNGNIAVEQYLYHRGDTDTSFRFGNDQWQIHAGGVQFVEFNESTTDSVTFNPNNVDVDFVVDGDTNEGIFHIDGSTENIGIGTTTPGAKLHLSANAADFAAEIYNDGDATTRSGLLIQAGLDDQAAAGPSTLIHFNDGDGGTIGSITFGSSVTNYNTTSDVRLKNDNGVSTKGLSDLLSIVVHDYTFKSDPGAKIHTGFMAQELYSIYPDAVTAYHNTDTFWQVDYGKLTPLIVRSIQEQQALIAALQQQQQQKMQQKDQQNETSLITHITDALAGHIELSEMVTTFVKRVVFNSSARFSGLVEFVSDVTFRTRVAFSDKDMAGFAKIKPGDNRVRVTFEKPFLFDPVVTLSAHDPDLRVGLSDVSRHGFTIVASASVSTDQVVNWVALLVLEPRVVESDGSGGEGGPVAEQQGQAPSTPQPTPQQPPSSSPQLAEQQSQGEVAGEATESGEVTQEQPSATTSGNTSPQE